MKADEGKYANNGCCI